MWKSLKYSNSGAHHCTCSNMSYYLERKPLSLFNPHLKILYKNLKICSTSQQQNLSFLTSYTPIKLASLTILITCFNYKYTTYKAYTLYVVFKHYTILSLLMYPR